MSDSSEDEDLSRFRDIVDNSFTSLINESRGQTQVANDKSTINKKSDRYLEESTHYNDVKVPAEMQKRIGEKISAIINKSVEFVDLENKIRKRKIKGGVKLFKDSEGYLTCEEAKDTYTEQHNNKSKKLKNVRRQIDADVNDLKEEDKVTAVTVSGDYILSKEDTKSWKSRRKEKLFKYKKQGESKALTAIE